MSEHNYTPWLRDITQALHGIRHELAHIAKGMRQPHGTLNAGIAFIRIEKELPVQTLPPHKSLNTNHAVLLLQPLDADGNAVDIATLGVPVSSDPAQSTASLRADGTGFDLSTPLDSGAVHYTFVPAGFDGLEFDFSYAPPAIGHLNPSFGDDAPDAA